MLCISELSEMGEINSCLGITSDRSTSDVLSGNGLLKIQSHKQPEVYF